MRIGEYKYLKNGNGYYLITEIDYDKKYYKILEIKKSGNDYIILDSNLGIAKEDLLEDEVFIFPKGRSRSKYENIISVYNYMGFNNLDSVRYNFDNEEDFFEELYESYNVDIDFLSKGKYKNYFYKLKDDLLTVDTIVDKLYTNKISRYSISFFNVITKIINIEDIKEVLWKNIGGSVVVELRWKNKRIVLTGVNKGSNELKYILKTSGFENFNNLNLNGNSGKLIKN